MEAVRWIAYVGGWLLFAGPIFQAAVELREEELERDALARAIRSTEPTPPVSAWWWLVPPVFYVKNLRRRAAMRDATLAAMEPHEVAALVSYMSKAHGWFVVAAGAGCIAVKETWELAHAHHWSWWAVVGLCLLGFAASVANTAAQSGRRRSILATKGIA